MVWLIKAMLFKYIWIPWLHVVEILTKAEIPEFIYTQVFFWKHTHHNDIGCLQLLFLPKSYNDFKQTG